MSARETRKKVVTDHATREQIQAPTNDDLDLEDSMDETLEAESMAVV